MKTEVRFRSSKFPPYDGEEEFINPGVWGKHLAEHLAARLNERGFATREAIAEDWGWYLPVQNEAFPLAVCCGHQDGASDEFLCFIDSGKPVLRRWFRKIDTTGPVGRLAEALAAILYADPDIREIHWSDQAGNSH